MANETIITGPPAPGLATTESEVLSDVIKGGPALSWRAILAGAFIALLTYVAMMALGAAIGGSAIQHVIRSESGGRALGWGAGIWMIVAVLVSLFVGGYLGARSSGLIPTRIGGIQGLVSSALFFAFVLFQVGSAVGLLGKGAGAVVGGAEELAKNPRVQSLVEKAVGDLNLRQAPDAVAAGVVSRLLSGDTDSAKTFLARQAGISTEDANRRIRELQADVVTTAKNAGIQAARVTRTFGWALFAAIVLGSFSAVMGGATGAGRNIRRPISERDRRAVHDSQAAWTFSHRRI